MDSWLERAAALRPDRTAVEAPEGSLTYAELLDAARHLELDAGPGDCVPIAVPPGVQFAVTLHACLLRGAAAMPVDLREPDAIVRARSVADDVALVVHTSGTTGEARPVPLSEQNILHSALGTAAMLGVHADDRWLCPLPLNHVGGLMVLLRSAIYATTAVIGTHDPEATLVSFVPTQLARGQDAGMPRLRAILLGGGPIPPELRRPGVLETYGMTETTSMAALDGFALPGVDIAIAEDGEILVSGPIVAGGGTHHTGDLGRVEDGRLIVTGRKSDTIITGGENVAPAEVEGVLMAHPGVEDAAVVGRPDPEWGEAVTASVVLRAPADPQELREWVAGRLARFKVPKAVEVAETLPRNPSGKLLRRELR